MARLKKTKQAVPVAVVTFGPPVPREPLPFHTRTPEWNGLKQGDAVTVRLPGKKAKRGVHYKFSNHVVSPEGHEYVDVIEYRVGYGSGLWRSFPVDAVSAIAQVKRRASAE